MENTVTQSAMRIRSGATQSTKFPGLLLLLVSRFLLLASYLLLLAGVAGARSFERRIRIPDLVQVEGETIRLSDVLPPDTPAELEEMCARITLGNLPYPSSQRVISKGQSNSNSGSYLASWNS